MCCVRCGRTENIEKHHIIQRIDGGGNAESNIQALCLACHDYEHARRAIQYKLEYEIKRQQKDRIALYEYRLKVLNELNTPEFIRARGTYIGYWVDNKTHYLPSRIPTKKEAKFDAQLEFWISEAQRS